MSEGSIIPFSMEQEFSTRDEGMTLEGKVTYVPTEHHWLKIIIQNLSPSFSLNPSSIPALKVNRWAVDQKPYKSTPWFLNSSPTNQVSLNYKWAIF